MKRSVSWVVAIAVMVGAMSLPLASAGAKSARPNIVQVAASNPQFSTLVALVKKAGLVSALEKPGALTVFAPTNAAFAAFAHAHPKLYSTVAHSKKLLAEVLEYHVAKGRLLAAAIEKRSSITTLLGQKVAVRVRMGAVYINQAKVVKANVLASNGVIHVINAVLAPKIG